MRPEGMESNPYDDAVLNPSVPEFDETSMYEAWEAGADAYEEGIKKGDYFIRVTDKAVTMPGFQVTVDDTVRGAGDGLWVFIPEDGCDLGEALNANALYEE